MNTSNREIMAFLQELTDSDVARGLFMVFDSFLNGFSLTENHSYLQMRGTNTLELKSTSKVASFSNGILHLVRYKGHDEIWFIVGHIHNSLEDLGFNLAEIVEN